jgi:hypothetical protein
MVKRGNGCACEYRTTAMEANAQAKGRKRSRSAGLKVRLRTEGYGETPVSSLPTRCQNAWRITSLSSLLVR